MENTGDVKGAFQNAKAWSDYLGFWIRSLFFYGISYTARELSKSDEAALERFSPLLTDQQILSGAANLFLIAASVMWILIVRTSCEGILHEWPDRWSFWLRSIGIVVAVIFTIMILLIGMLGIQIIARQGFSL